MRNFQTAILILALSGFAVAQASTTAAKPSTAKPAAAKPAAPPAAPQPVQAILRNIHGKHHLHPLPR